MAATTEPYGQNDVIVEDGMTFLRLLSAESISSTGVLLTFSHPVVVAPEQATLAFGILTSSGTPLALQRLVIQGNTVRIDTDWQEPIVYQVRLGPVITGTDANGAMLTLDPEQSPMLFVGGQTSNAITTPPIVSPSTTRGDILSLRLRATTEADKTVTVEGAWTVAQDIAITGYRVEQSLDGGRTFSAPVSVPKESMGLRIPRVPGGTFTLRVTAVYSDNSNSTGKTETIAIASGSGLGATVTGPKPTSPLSSSGPGLWLTVSLSGAVAGYVMTKRRMARA